MLRDSLLLSPRLAIAWEGLLPRLRLVWREHGDVVMRSVTTHITAHLSRANRSKLASLHRVCLSARALQRQRGWGALLDGITATSKATNASKRWLKGHSDNCAGAGVSRNGNALVCPRYPPQTGEGLAHKRLGTVYKRVLIRTTV